MQEIFLTREQLERLHTHCVGEPDGALATALRTKGNEALSAGPFTVMDKTLTPPSGDKHDFLRMPTYAWPNPDTPDGLPYITRDGEVGPGGSGEEYDMARMRRFTDTVIELSWAGLATGAPEYAERAAHLVRVWFLDPDTRMNPNLTYSKYTPGDEPPYPTGVIATHRWVPMMQAFGILAASEEWSDDVAEGLSEWFDRYLDWLQTSDQGSDERSFRNNRGTWYEAQCVAFSRFLGRDEYSRTVIRESCPRRLDHQIAADGSLPEELRRTNSFTYSMMTLTGWSTLSLMADLLGMDLWGWTSDDGRSLKSAFEYLAPYIGRSGEWPHQQIKPVPPGRSVFPYRAAAAAYRDPVLIGALRRLDPTVVQSEPATVLFA